MPFLFPPGLTAMTSTSSTMLSKSGESRHPIMFLILKEMLLVLPHWGRCWLWDCHMWPLLCWDTIPIFPRCWEFIINVINVYWTSSNAFPSSTDMIMWFLSFILFMCSITLIDLQILYQPCIPGINPTWLWYLFFLLYCWIWFGNILLRIFGPCSSGILAYKLQCLVWVWN